MKQNKTKPGEKSTLMRVLVLILAAVIVIGIVILPLIS